MQTPQTFAGLTIAATLKSDSGVTGAFTGVLTDPGSGVVLLEKWLCSYMPLKK